MSGEKILLAILLLPWMLPAAMAQGHHRGHEHGPGPGWHGEIGRFHEHDLGRWRGGQWHHERHHGRLGWWWIVGGVWYFYPSPVYPYPDPYQPPLAPVPPPAAPQYWYYCTDPAGYYPYIAQCRVNWQAVPSIAVPPAPGDAPMPYPQE